MSDIRNLMVATLAFLGVRVRRDSLIEVDGPHAPKLGFSLAWTRPKPSTEPKPRVPRGAPRGAALVQIGGPSARDPRRTVSLAPKLPCN